MPERRSSGVATPTARELLAAAALLTLVGVAAYGWFVSHGGFYSDDWANASGYRFADPPRYWSSVGDLEAVLGGRPLLALLLPVPHALFGVDHGLHLGMALGLGIVTSLCLYLLLRTLAMAPLDAGAIASLALLFPWSDSIRLWPTASVNSVAVCLFLVGLVVALRGLEHRGRSGVAMHAAADVLYLLSVLTYEVTAAATLLAGFLYVGRAPRTTVGRRWLADVVVVLAALSYSLTTTVAARHVGSIAERLGDVGAFVRESLLLLASALLPAGSLGRPVQALALLLATAVVALAIVRLHKRDDPELRAWVRWIAIGVVAVAAAYFVFLGSELHPLDPGIYTRINVFAGLAYCVLVYALVATASRLLFGSRPLATATTMAAVAAIGVGYGVQLANDEADWRDAAVRQRGILDLIGRSLPELPPSSTLVTFGFPAQEAPEVPVFDKGWDLSGALQLRSNDPTIRAYPIYRGISVRCGRRLAVRGGGSYGAYGIGYGRVFFLDATGYAKRVGSPAQCASALRRFDPGTGRLPG